MADFRLKFIDGTAVPVLYLQAVSNLVAAAAAGDPGEEGERDVLVEHIELQPMLGDRILAWIKAATDEQLETFVDQMVESIDFDLKSKWSRAIDAAEYVRWIRGADTDELYELIDEVVDWFDLQSMDNFLPYVAD